MAKGHSDSERKEGYASFNGDDNENDDEDGFV